MDSTYHIPVLLEQTINYLISNVHGIYVDATLGGGGHTEAILQKGKTKVVGFDSDPDSIKYVQSRLDKKFKDRYILFNENFGNLKKVLADEKVKDTFKCKNDSYVDGILFDLGVSSFQLNNVERGFTYKHDTVLDLRMNNQIGKPAYEVLNTYSENELERIFRVYSEDRYSDSLARSIVNQRQTKEFKTTFDLVNMITPFVGEYKLNNVLSRIFQGLRIEVNNELDNLKKVLEDSIDFLVPGGRIVVISYQSLEDRIVKSFFKEKSISCTCPKNFPKCVCDTKQILTILTTRPLIPNEEEIRANVRARSAKLRAAEKL